MLCPYCGSGCWVVCDCAGEDPECSDCGGEGEYVCPECEGEGTIACEACGGTGAVPAANGIRHAGR